MFVSKRRGGSRKPSFHGAKLQSKVKDDSDISCEETSDYIEEVVNEEAAKEKFGVRGSVADKAAYIKVGLIDEGIFGDGLKEKRARSDFVLGGIQVMMEQDPESGKFNVLASSARRRLLQEGIPFFKSYVNANGYLMESPPLSGFKDYIDSIEPLYHHLSSALWTLPAFNLRLIEKVTPSFVSGASTEVAYNLFNVTVDMIITSMLAPASILYLGLHCLSTSPGQTEEEVKKGEESCD
ncbi:hypothetical protein DSO57_1004842 [Entomophthora muscae]|uniref:Uncharacterized protein n=1 Tax=Entomophthora muscae TaxID=34485 RepID=A0ACC2SA83_9FUNG|nr:hypothetical protein DSO57_1004842 [Entomophthora muscae]